MTRLIISALTRGEDGRIRAGGINIDPELVPAHAVTPLSMLICIIAGNHIRVLPATPGLASLSVNTTQRGKCVKEGLILVEGRHYVRVNPAWTSPSEINGHGFIEGRAFFSDAYIGALLK